MGEWIAWYKNGQKQSEGNFKDGKPDGLFIAWYENGQKKSEAGDRTYKLGSDTTSEYGRYVKSLWEARGGAHPSRDTTSAQFGSFSIPVRCERPIRRC